MEIFIEKYKDGVRVNFLLYIPYYHIPNDIEKIKQIYNHWIEYQKNPNLVANQVNQIYFLSHSFYKGIIDSSLRFFNIS
jgi:hypothetical protein